MDYPQRALAATEFRLMVECCRWAFAGGDGTAVDELAGTADWTGVLRLVRRHRVQALVWHSLHGLGVDVPSEVADQLAADSAGIAQHNLVAASASKQLCEAFGDAGVPLLFIKGLTLAGLAYANPFLKMSWDIDVLIEPDGIATAAGVLEKVGYHPLLPARSLEAWHKRRKESVWMGSNGAHVELHSRLADSRDLLASIDVSSPRQDVEISPGLVLPTLTTDELFAYLCVHGASSAWFRLKWITDLAALLDRSRRGEIARLYQRAQQLGAGRAAAQALLLARDIYGTALGPDFERELKADRSNRWLARSAASQLARENEPTETPLGTATIHLTQFGLLPGLGFKLRELGRQIGDAVGNRL